MRRERKGREVKERSEREKVKDRRWLVREL